MRAWLNTSYTGAEIALHAEMSSRLAGSGPLSDGVPKPIGRGGASERSMPAPPKASRKIDERDDVDDTVPMRRKP